MINQLVEQVVQYGIDHDFFTEIDRLYMRNRLCDYLGIDGFSPHTPLEPVEDIHRLLDSIVKWAYDQGLIESVKPPYSEIFDTGLIDILLPKPSEVNDKFWSLYKVSPKKAMDWYYAFSKATNYIRLDRMALNKIWKTASDFGDIDITINLSKPEKDPKAIEAAAKLKASGYPSCLLCYENEGYKGRLDHPARHSHRVVHMTLNEEPWFIQYSPYGYYNEHMIVVNKAHTPMKISKATFRRLGDFVDTFDHYFVGSNADLPLVGGSMLSHDHYQAGNYTMPMALASDRQTFTLKAFDQVKFARLNWPLSVIRLKTKSKDALVEAADHIRHMWAQHTDEEAGIYAFTGDTPHHTLTPIMRKNQGEYELDLVLRDNRRSDDHPDGIYHPHTDVHPIKKENIGLIEVMGLAVLPARLDDLILDLEDALEKELTHDQVVKIKGLEAFGDIYTKMANQFALTGLAEKAVKDVIGQVFTKGLMDCGVYPLTDQGDDNFARFVAVLNER